MKRKKESQSRPTHCGYKSGYSETTHENTSVTYVFDFFLFIGAAKRIRTPDPRITNALLYQLSYCGVFEAGGILTRDITRRKTGTQLCDVAQGFGQGEYHVFLAAVQFGRHFPAPLA
jgi:hypothetical protein